MRDDVGRRSRRGRSVDAAGIRIAFESMPAHFPPDESPFKGLYDDCCQCDHWGYLFEGTSGSRTRTAERTRSCAPGRPTTCARGASSRRSSRWVIELSPAEEHDRTMGTVARNLGAPAG